MSLTLNRPNSSFGEIIRFSDKLHYLFTILLKGSHLFKIAELIISFCLKKNYNLTILNKYTYFSRIVDHVTCSHDQIISPSFALFTDSSAAGNTIGEQREVVLSLFFF